MGDPGWPCMAAVVCCHVVLAAALVTAAAVDLARRVIPNGCAVAVLGSGVARALLGTVADGEPGRLGDAALGVAVVLGVMLVTAWASARPGGEAGVGGGDVKLLSALGAWAGPVGGLAIVALSCALGVACWASRRALEVLLAREGAAGNGICLAPAIAFGALVVLGVGGVLSA